MSASPRVPRGGRRVLSWVLCCAPLAPVSLTACRDEVRAEAPEAARARVTGTVLDARNGEPLVGVRVSGPRDADAVSDLYGRFELRGLRVGDSGRLSARRAPTEDSPALAGELPLRSLRPGRHEVVFHLGPRKP